MPRPSPRFRCQGAFVATSIVLTHVALFQSFAQATAQSIPPAVSAAPAQPAQPAQAPQAASPAVAPAPVAAQPAAPAAAPAPGQIPFPQMGLPGADTAHLMEGWPNAAMYGYGMPSPYFDPSGYYADPSLGFGAPRGECLSAIIIANTYTFCRHGLIRRTARCQVPCLSFPKSNLLSFTAAFSQDASAANQSARNSQPVLPQGAPFMMPYGYFPPSHFNPYFYPPQGYGYAPAGTVIPQSRPHLTSCHIDSGCTLQGRVHRPKRLRWSPKARHADIVRSSTAWIQRCCASVDSSVVIRHSRRLRHQPRRLEPAAGPWRGA